MKDIRDEIPLFSLTPNPGGLMRNLTIIFCAALVIFSLHQAHAKIIHVPADSSTIRGRINGTSSGEYVITPEITEPCEVE